MNRYATHICFKTYSYTIHIYIYIYIYIYVYVCVYTYVVYIYIYIYIYIYKYIYIYVHVKVSIHMSYDVICIYIYMYIYIHISCTPFCLKKNMISVFCSRIGHIQGYCTPENPTSLYKIRWFPQDNDPRNGFSTVFHIYAG